MPRKDVGVDKVLKKLQASVDEGKFYEASQMYHSLSQRYLKSGKEDIAKVDAAAANTRPIGPALSWNTEFPSCRAC